MANRVPKNKIIENKYTLGNEFIKTNTLEEYKGYYCIVGNKIYTGKTYDTNSIELQKKSNSSKYQSILNIGSLAMKYALNSNINIFSSYNTDNGYTPNEDSKVRYFLKKLNVIPISIKEIDEKLYNIYINDKLYQVTSIEYNNKTGFDPMQFEKATSEMKGLKEFLSP